MTEPKYDEDVVNLGYLKKVVNNEIDGEKEVTISRHYTTKPSPPYYAGDTWQDGHIVYTCINTRLIGFYNDEDWTTESGAKEEAESKNKIYLTQPYNYSIGDMWILQSDTDHKAGKKGEILITTAGRREYDEGDWVNMLGYGSITSINQVADELNKAIGRIGVVEEAVKDGIITTYYQNTVPEIAHLGDLWFVTEDIEDYKKGKLYRYNGTSWQLLDDPEIQKAFEEANEARLVADGKIQSFYTETEPTENIGVGDLWIDTGNKNKLYRYNGTNWVAVYDTRIDELIQTSETTSKTVTELQTDLGKITARVSTTETTTNELTTEIGNVNSNLSNEINNLNDNFQQVFEEYKETIGTQLTQTNKDWTFEFNKIVEQITNIDGTVNENYNELIEYIRFQGGSIILGEVNNPLKLTLSKDRMSFLQNGTEVAYVSNNKLYIYDGEFLNSLTIGRWVYIVENDGGLSLNYI